MFDGLIGPRFRVDKDAKARFFPQLSLVDSLFDTDALNLHPSDLDLNLNHFIAERTP